MRLSPRLVVVGLIASVGCGGGGVSTPIAPTAYDPAAMADAAMKQYDKNADGKLAGAELDACPALKSVLADLDKNKDKSLDRTEIQDRISDYTRLNIGSMMVGGRAFVNGEPMENLEVTLVPEDFMQGTAATGTGKTDANGTVAITGSPGLACGFYRVKFSLKIGGTEMLPAKFTVGSAVGFEVFTGRGGGGSFEFQVTK